MRCVVLGAEGERDARDEWVARLREHLPRTIDVTSELTQIPASWEPLVVVVRMTAAALADTALSAQIRTLVGRVLVLPVVDDRTAYDFRALRGAWARVAQLNVIDASEEERLLEGIRVGLGIEPNRLQRRVFLSYCRADGLEIARTIQGWLEDGGYSVFRDETGLDAGARAQREVMRSLRDADFVLLLCTPRLHTSQWVNDELMEALANRVPLHLVLVDEAQVPSIVGRPPVLAWSSPQPPHAPRLLSFVNAGVGSREVVGRQVESIVDETVRDLDLSLPNVHLPPRARLIQGTTDRRVLVVWSDREPSLEALHSAHELRSQVMLGGSRVPTVVCSATRAIVSSATWTAADWASAHYELFPVPLTALESKLLELEKAGLL